MFKKISLYLSSLVFVLTTIGSAYAVTLKASHQWPGTPRADGSYDPRHEMVQIIADEVKKANVGVDIRIYPAKSLYKPKEQWKPMTTGQLDISAFPLAYASKFHPEFDATLMPGTVKNHDHALRFNKGPMMTEIKKIINDAGVVVLSDAWLGGGFASKTKCIKNPSDAKGQVMRAAGKAFNQMLEAAGAGIQSMPSSEIYTGLQTGVLTGANTSSGSFVSYKIYEQVSCATPPGKFGLWFMYEPILMSKKSYDALSSKQQKALMKAGKVAEKYMTAQVENLDKKFEDAYKAANRGFFMKKKYLQLCDHIAKACGAFAVLALLLSILVIVELVFERYFFQRAITWQTELVTMLLVASTFIGSVYVLSEKAHVSMEWIYDFLSKKNIIRLKIFTSSISLLFFLILFYFGFLMFEEAFTKNYSTGTVWDPPLWIPYSSMMLGALLMILQYIAEIIKLTDDKDFK